MHNDAYTGASHGPDVAFIVPVFHGGQLIAFACTTAHHLDIGALSPGSCGIVDALDAYAEGLQFKAIRVYEQGRRIEPVWQLLRDNIRVSDLVVGDMEAQIAAARIGGDRDGNPNVTAELTRKALAEMRSAAVERHAQTLESLRLELSVSGRRTKIDPALLASIAKDEAERPLTAAAGSAVALPERIFAAAMMSWLAWVGLMWSVFTERS